MIAEENRILDLILLFKFTESTVLMFKPILLIVLSCFSTLLLALPATAQSANASSATPNAQPPTPNLQRQTPNAKRQTPSLNVTGLFSLWAGTAFGDSLGGNVPRRDSPTPPGRNFGGGATEVFKLRRGNINLNGGLLPDVDYHVQFNVSKFGTESGSVLQEIWLGYRFSPEFRVEVGRQKTGLTEEGTRSDDKVLTIARSLMSEALPSKSGRVGNARATGIALRYQTGRINSFVGLWDGNGEHDGLLSDNHLNFLDAGIFIKTLRRFTFGVWGGRKISYAGAKEVRDRAGATMLFESGPHTFEIEGAYARDYGRIRGSKLNGGSIAIGFYILYAHKISKQWQIVARYDVWDPAQHDQGDTLTEVGVLVPRGDHKFKEYTFGVNYNASKHLKFQINYIRDDTEVNGSSYFGKPRTVLLTAAKLSF